MDDTLRSPGHNSLKVHKKEEEVASEISSSKVSEVDNDSEAGFLIENHLGQAVGLIEQDDIDRL